MLSLHFDSGVGYVNMFKGRLFLSSERPGDDFFNYTAEPQTPNALHTTAWLIFFMRLSLSEIDK